MPNQTFSVFKTAKLVDHILQEILICDSEIKIETRELHFFCGNTWQK